MMKILPILLLFSVLEFTCLAARPNRKSAKNTDISCGRPPSIKNGHFIGTKFTVGHKVRYYCKKGYRLVARRTRMKCKRNGKWNRKPPKCKETSCARPLSIENGNFTGTNFTVGEIVNYHCNKGYRLVGQRRIICRQNLRWNKKPPRCKELKCRGPRRLFLLNGNVNTTDPKYRYGATLIFRCKPGYTILGYDTITCTENGWTYRRFPRCRRPRCPDPGIPDNGRKLGSQRWVGSTIKFYCHSGYKLRGTNIRECLPNLRWSGTLATCDDGNSYCYPLGKPINGRKIGRNYDLGDVVKFSCDRGYILKGSNARKCMINRKWNGSEAICLDENTAFFKDVNASARFIRENIIDEFKDFTCSSDNKTCNVTTADSRARAIDMGRPGGLDLVFVFDGSSSVLPKDFKKELHFAITLVRMLGATSMPGGTQVAALTFGTETRINFNLGDFEVNTLIKVENKIKKIRQPGGGTATRLALDTVRKVVAPIARESAQKVLFFVTDGRSNIGGSPERAAEKLKEKHGFEIYAIGVGKAPKMKELMAIASEPGDEHVLSVADYETFKEAIEKAKVIKIDYTPCGVSKTNFRARIVGGNKVKRGTWPWQVGVWLGVNKRPHCGGSLIAKRWILTAAHCFYDMRTKTQLLVPDGNFFVKAGDHHINKQAANTPEQKIRAKNIFIHQDFNPRTLFNDIALIKLRRNAKLNKYVRTVCLPKDSKEDLATAGKHGYVAGWGITELGTQSNVLLHTALPVQDNAICNNSTKYHVNMTQVFCAGDGKGGNDTCRGDSGGPFVRERYDKVSDDYRWIQVGLVSWGPNDCGKKDKYGFYTRTASYINWIKNTKKDNSGDDEK